jgi:hypothetical protein
MARVPVFHVGLSLALAMILGACASMPQGPASSIDVTGAWHGTWHVMGNPNSKGTIRLILQQMDSVDSVAFVVGDVFITGASFTSGELEGRVSSNVFTFSVGPTLLGEVRLNEESMSGFIVARGVTAAMTADGTGALGCSRPQEGRDDRATTYGVRDTRPHRCFRAQS